MHAALPRYPLRRVGQPAAQQRSPGQSAQRLAPHAPHDSRGRSGAAAAPGRPRPTTAGAAVVWHAGCCSTGCRAGASSRQPPHGEGEGGGLVGLARGGVPGEEECCGRPPAQLRALVLAQRTRAVCITAAGGSQCTRGALQPPLSPWLPPSDRWSTPGHTARAARPGRQVPFKGRHTRHNLFIACPPSPLAGPSCNPCCTRTRKTIVSAASTAAGRLIDTPGR
jgi:hypothetical protein